MTYRLCLMHPMDPRGSKLGGIETHVRLILSRHPADFSVLLVGVDEAGDLPPGRIARISMDGRSIDFLPVARISPDQINTPAKALLKSTTLRFAAGALRHLGAIRRAVKGASASADLQRFEFALLPKLLGLKTVQMVHGEGSKDDKMDSLIKKYWFIHRLNEKLALYLASQIQCVNPSIVKRIEREFPKQAHKAEIMTVSVDTEAFPPKPYDTRDGVFRVVFAGRLDEFKDPPLMFRTLLRLHGRLGGKLEFHYLGTTDPHRYAEFAAIELFTVRHGFQPAAEVARITAGCHAGILTSHFEGMPCYLLETLSLGRPFGAIRLPQYDPLIVAGTSGGMAGRLPDAAANEAALADIFMRIWNSIRAGEITPEQVHQLVQPYSVKNQMARLFEHHRRLQGGGLKGVGVNRVEANASLA